MRLSECAEIYLPGAKVRHPPGLRQHGLAATDCLLRSDALGHVAEDNRHRSTLGLAHAEGVDLIPPV